MPDLTVCLLNYRRTQNYYKILPALAAQTIRPVIFLWNNGESFRGDESFLAHVDWLVESSDNRGCVPRWWMAAAADTEFVCSWDDDLIPTDFKLFEDAVGVYRKLNLSGAVGPYGVEFERNKPYEHCWHHKAEKMSARLTLSDKTKLMRETDPHAREQAKRRIRRERLRDVHVPVDVIKGRHLMAPTAKLRQLADIWAVSRLEDDIAISGRLANGKPAQHAVLGIYQNRFHDLEDNASESGSAVSQQIGHFARRQKARQLYFPGL
jgi:hypothetical protein